VKLHARFNDRAEAELAEAASWYGLISASLRDEYLFAVEKAVDEILDAPRSCPVIAGRIRRKLVTRFPYALLYRIKRDHIRILAVMHQKRRPLYWFGGRK
jgi:plasmid stabilization system protein ParE